MSNTIRLLNTAPQRAIFYFLASIGGAASGAGIILDSVIGLRFHGQSPATQLSFWFGVVLLTGIGPMCAVYGGYLAGRLR
jgi:hypothetical protein